jgi:hypothetical protein
VAGAAGGSQVLRDFVTSCRGDCPLGGVPSATVGEGAVLAVRTSRATLSISAEGTVPSAPLTGNSSLLLFQGQSATQLKNGWSIKLFELEGGQYKPMGTSDTLVAAWITLGAPNRTYNYKLTKLVLQKLIGSCTNVIGEAF